MHPSDSAVFVNISKKILSDWALGFVHDLPGRDLTRLWDITTGVRTTAQVPAIRLNNLILIFLAEAGSESKHKLDAFDFIHPIGERGV